MSPLLTTRLSPFKEVFVKCVSTQGTYYIKLVSTFVFSKARYTLPAPRERRYMSPYRSDYIFILSHKNRSFPFRTPIACVLLPLRIVVRLL